MTSVSMNALLLLLFMNAQNAVAQSIVGKQLTTVTSH
jgi:hypothetical protein